MTLKYVTLIMSADNRGEGGIMALTALVGRGLTDRRSRWWLVGLGIFGAAMFYGDGMITPAISVLSAVEGLDVMAPVLKPYVVPVTIVILIALFSIQRHGTARVGVLFGPVTCVWFIAIAALGAIQVARDPEVLAALNPAYAFRFLTGSPLAAFLALGAVVLAVTGTEALYADMGHFGASPIRRAWLFFVLPALVLNYFGQGALIIHDPAAVKNPFYLLAPGWALLPMVVLATCATVIASQAVISGAFSLTRQAIQMGYCPRLTVTHTSDRQIGQIYVPFINWILLAAVMLLVVGFQSSSNLAAAYGIAVTMALTIDSLLIYVVLTRLWHWHRVGALAIVVPLLLVDMSFLASNALKIPQGGWFPIAIGIVVFTLLTTWKRGRAILQERVLQETMPIDLFVSSIQAAPPMRVPGTGRIPDQHRGARSRRAAAQPQAQQGAARARRAAYAQDARRAGRSTGRTSAHRGPRLQLPADRGLLRVHGGPGHPDAARGMRPARGGLRHDGHLVLRLARNADTDGGARDGALAREALRVDVQERNQGDRVLQHPDQPRGRIGDAGRALKEKRRREAGVLLRADL